MDEGRALYETVCDHPLDDVPRLVYADWLQENGDEARAEFIRVQCELESTTDFGDDYFLLRQRESELWEAHRRRWAEGLPADLGGEHGPFFRGFPGRLRLWHGEIDADSFEFDRYSPGHRHPYTAISIRTPLAEFGERVLSSPGLASIRDVQASVMRGDSWGDRFLAILARSPHTFPIPGFKTEAQVRDNLGALEKGPLPAAVMAEINAVLHAEMTEA